MLVAAVAAACSSGPAQPAAVIGVPTAVSPAANTSIGLASQPVTLTATNAVSSGATTLTYNFEVATDAGFTNKVQTKDAAQGNGQTSVILDPGLPAKDYFWHVRASGGGTTGVFCNPVRFSVVNITAPTPLSPTNGATITGWPTFIVADVQRPGGGPTLSYRFDISTSNTFSSILASGTVPETPTQTSFTPNATLPSGQPTLFWRATAIDTTGLQSPSSTTQNFVLNSSVAAQLAAQVPPPLGPITLWPGIQPPGTPGHATLGDNWTPATQYYQPGNVFFQTPTAEMLRLFDLIDRGLQPDDAINWLNANGYPTIAQWYPPPEKAVLGIQYVYIGCVPVTSYPNCHWDIIVKTE